jgi:hypothetical protein
MLEYENFDDIFVQAPTTEYEIFMGRIKGGTVKNSADLAMPETNTQDIQTEKFE